MMNRKFAIGAAGVAILALVATFALSAVAADDSEPTGDEAITNLVPLTAADVDGDVERYYEEIGARVETWKDEIEADSWSDEELTRGIDALSTAQGELSEEEFVPAVYELGRRLQALCLLLSDEHPYRADYCPDKG